MLKVASKYGSIKLNSAVTLGISLITLIIALVDFFNWRFGLQAIFWFLISMLLLIFGKKKWGLEFSENDGLINLFDKYNSYKFKIDDIKSIEETSYNSSVLRKEKNFTNYSITLSTKSNTKYKKFHFMIFDSEIEHCKNIKLLQYHLAKWRKEKIHSQG